MVTIRALLPSSLLALAALSCGAETPPSGASPRAAEATPPPAATAAADERTRAGAVTLEGLPEACELVSLEEVAELLAVAAPEVAVERRHRPADASSTCSWRVGSGLAVRRLVDLAIRASYTRGDYEAGGADLTTEDYARRLLPEGWTLVAHDPALAAGSYLFENDTGYFLHVDTPLALASVPRPLPHEPAAADKLVVTIVAGRHDGWPGAREAVLQLAGRVAEEMEDAR